MLKKAWVLSIIFIIFNLILFALLLVPYWFTHKAGKNSGYISTNTYTASLVGCPKSLGWLYFLRRCENCQIDIAFKAPAKI